MREIICNTHNQKINILKSNLSQLIELPKMNLIQHYTTNSDIPKWMYTNQKLFLLSQETKMIEGSAAKSIVLPLLYCLG